MIKVIKNMFKPWTVVRFLREFDQKYREFITLAPLRSQKSHIGETLDESKDYLGY